MKFIMILLVLANFGSGCKTTDSQKRPVNSPKDDISPGGNKSSSAERPVANRNYVPSEIQVVTIKNLNDSDIVFLNLDVEDEQSLSLLGRTRGQSTHQRSPSNPNNSNNTNNQNVRPPKNQNPSSSAATSSNNRSSPPATSNQASNSQSDFVETTLSWGKTFYSTKSEMIVENKSVIDVGTFDEAIADNVGETIDLGEVRFERFTGMTPEGYVMSFIRQGNNQYKMEETNRATAESLLIDNNTYLLRTKPNGELVVSARDAGGGFQHSEVKRTPNGQYQVSIRNSIQTFDNLEILHLKLQDRNGFGYRIIAPNEGRILLKRLAVRNSEAANIASAPTGAVLVLPRAPANAKTSATMITTDTDGVVSSMTSVPPIIYSQLPDLRQESERTMIKTNLDRQEAEKVLRKYGQLGSYIVRTSSGSQGTTHAFSQLVQGDEVVHTGLVRLSDGRWKFSDGSNKDPRIYDSLPSLLTSLTFSKLSTRLELPSK